MSEILLRSDDTIPITINLKWITDKRMISTLNYKFLTIILWTRNGILFLFVFNLLIICEKVVAQECQTKRVPPQNKLLADCSGLKINYVPSKLDPKIEILDLSRNFIFVLDRESFSKYIELIEIIMTDSFYDSTHLAAVNPDTFQPLQKLEILLMDDTFYDGVNFNFPVSLKRLSFSGNRRKEFDVSNLKALQNLSLNRNLLDNLPLVHPLAPLTHLYLSQNPLKGLTAEGLANFCSLEYLDLEISKTSDSNTIESNYCQCLRLEKWIEQLYIAGTKSLKCLPSSNRNCDLNFVEAKANYTKCLMNHGITFRSWPLKWLLFLIVFAILTFIIGFMIYEHYFSTESESPSEFAPSTSSESPTSEKSYEDGPDEITSEEQVEDEE